MQNKCHTARSMRPNRSNRSLQKSRGSARNQLLPEDIQISKLKWRTNYSSGQGVLPGTQKDPQVSKNKENSRVNGRRFRSGSRARYQRSMHGSGIAELMKFDSNRPEPEIKVRKFKFLFVFDRQSRIRRRNRSMRNPILPGTHENVSAFRPTIRVSEQSNKTTLKTTRAQDEMIQKLGRGVYGVDYQNKKRSEIPYKSGVK